jgi:hypothetical protein
LAAKAKRLRQPVSRSAKAEILPVLPQAPCLTQPVPPEVCSHCQQNIPIAFRNNIM